MKLKEFMKDTLTVSKGAMKISTKGVIEDYREKYNVMIQDRNKQFRSDVYTVQPGNRIMVHIKVPSESVPNFHYDTMFELTAEKSAVDFGDCDIKIFSNSPSFVYSVAYIFAHWDPDRKEATEKGKGMMIDTLKGKLPRDRMLIPGIENKLGKRPIREAPVTRNPMGLPLFDKSIYFAIFYMMDNLDFNKTMNNHRFRTARQVFDSVAFFDRLMIERKKAENRQKESKAAKRVDVDRDMSAKERELDKVNRSGMMRPQSTTAPKRMGSTARKPSGLKGMKSTRRPK